MNMQNMNRHDHIIAGLERAKSLHIITDWYCYSANRTKWVIGTRYVQYSLTTSETERFLDGINATLECATRKLLNL